MSSSKSVLLAACFFLFLPPADDYSRSNAIFQPGILVRFRRLHDSTNREDDIRPDRLLCAATNPLWRDNWPEEQISSFFASFLRHSPPLPPPIPPKKGG